MYTTEGDNLFAGHWLTDYLQHRATDVRQAVESIPRTEFESTDNDSLIARVLAAIRVEPLVLDRDNIELSTEDVTLDARDDPNRAAHHFRDHFVPLPATQYTFSVPFAGDPTLWELQPSTFGLVYARGLVRHNRGGGVLDLVFVRPKDKKEEELKQHLDEELALIEQNRERQRPEVDAFNSGLRESIRVAVEARRQEFASHEGMAERFGVRLKKDPAPSLAAPEPVRPARRATVTASTVPAGTKKWDVFISYAGEDRETVARPLAEALRARGLAVWFDKFELSLGDRLRRKIDEGLANSRYGAVVLSPAFFQKHWPQLELDGLAQREVDGQKVILPIWHNIDHAGVATYSPTLADRMAASWSDGLERVVDEIIAVVRPA